MKPHRLSEPFDVELPDGSVYTLRPGPRGKGIAIQPHAAKRNRAASQGPGRPPRASTVALREMLARDAGSGRLKVSSHYIDWLSAQEPKSKRTTLQQTVYREMRSVAPKRGPGRRKGGKGGQAGRQPHPGTVILRERLAKDRSGDGLQDASHYVRWLVDKANLGIKQARPIVYRELRAAK
jgi:hypothetical protein